MTQRTSREQLKNRREQTKERLLKAGRDILTTEPVGGIATHVRSGDVTKRAKLSAGSLYYHWMSQDEYIFDLVEFVLDGICEDREAHAEHQALHVFAATLEARKPFPVAVRAAGNQVFAQLQDDPTVFVQLALWAAHPKDGEITNRLKDMYERVEACWIPRIDETLRRQGRRWRPPYDARLFTTTLTALAEGLLLRAKVDPDAIADLAHPDGPWSVFATTTISLYQAATAAAGRRRTKPPVDVRDLPTKS